MLRRFTPKFLEPTEFLVSSLDVDKYLRPSGDFITLPPGERITFMINDPGEELGGHIARQSSCAYIFDAVGNRHFVSSSQFSKLKRDYEKK